MFHWICPECGREIPPSVMECPACDLKAAPSPAPVESAREILPAASTEPEIALDPLLVLAEQIRAAQVECPPAPPPEEASPGLLELAAAVGISEAPGPSEPAEPAVPEEPALPEPVLEPVGAMPGLRYPAPQLIALQSAPAPVALLAPPAPEPAV